jgi:APA family basic amino acid/polyamine antiporter
VTLGINVTFIAGEIKEPKNIPRSLFLVALIVTIIYVLANVAYLALLTNAKEHLTSVFLIRNHVLK